MNKGTITVPYDVFVDKGELSTIGDKKYLLLTLNNEASTVISIEVDSLVDVYTAVDSDTIDMDVNDFKISAFVKDGSITGNKIAAQAISSMHVSEGAIDSYHLADYAVTEDKLDNGAVTSAKIDTGAVTTDKILSAAVTGDKIADGSIRPYHVDTTYSGGVWLLDGGGAYSEPNEGWDA